MKVVLIGYGKMGKTLHTLLEERNHEVIGVVDIKNSKNLNNELKKADIAIEFSTPDTAFANINSCIESNIPVVSGTTGWLDQYTEVTNNVKKHNGAFFYASNYSIGVNIFFELNKHLAKIMNNFSEYDVQMEEIHHIEK